jgi:hypothetical protein
LHDELADQPEEYAATAAAADAAGAASATAAAWMDKDCRFQGYDWLFKSLYTRSEEQCAQCLQAAVHGDKKYKSTCPPHLAVAKLKVLRMMQADPRSLVPLGEICDLLDVKRTCRAMSMHNAHSGLPVLIPVPPFETPIKVNSSYTYVIRHVIYIDVPDAQVLLTQQFENVKKELCVLTAEVVAEIQAVYRASGRKHDAHSGAYASLLASLIGSTRAHQLTGRSNCTTAELKASTAELATTRSAVLLGASL